MLTIKVITDALGLSRWRVEQWISRGHFKVSDSPPVGTPREWDVNDAMRLAIFAALVDAGVSVQQAGIFTESPVYPHDGWAVFVADNGVAISVPTGNLAILLTFDEAILHMQSLKTPHPERSEH